MPREIMCPGRQCAPADNVPRRQFAPGDNMPWRQCAPEGNVPRKENPLRENMPWRKNPPEIVCPRDNVPWKTLLLFGPFWLGLALFGTIWLIFLVPLSEGSWGAPVILTEGNIKSNSYLAKVIQGIQ